jgi:prephenate dehydratase
MVNTVAYQGTRGAYSHLSCLQVFPNAEALACDDFHSALAMVEEGKADRAMIPLENSTAGRVEEIYRLLPNTSLSIIGEHFEPVNHCLLAPKGTELADIKEVASHPQALAQCQQRLRNLGMRPRAAVDTAVAARQLSEQPQAGQGAIASSLAAELYDLAVLRQNFQDVSGNTTRFLVFAREQEHQQYQADEHYITSLLFTVRNIPAALYKALGGFATNGVNLIKLESYMDGGTMEASHFHVDMYGHPQQPAMQHALEELRYFARELRLLGTYPAHHYRHRADFV